MDPDKNRWLRGGKCWIVWGQRLEKYERKVTRYEDLDSSINTDTQIHKT